MNLDYKLIGKRIKICRIQKNITQYELSEILNVSNVYISKIERGKTKLNLEMLFKISNTLDVSVTLLLVGIDENCSEYLELEIHELLQGLDHKKKKIVYAIIKIIVNS